MLAGGKHTDTVAFYVAPLRSPLCLLSWRNKKVGFCCGARHLRRRRCVFLIFSSACGTQNFLLAIRSRNFDHGACLPTRCFCHWQRSCAQPLPLAPTPSSVPGSGRVAPLWARSVSISRKRKKQGQSVIAPTDSISDFCLAPGCYRGRGHPCRQNPRTYPAAGAGYSGYR